MDGEEIIRHANRLVEKLDKQRLKKFNDKRDILVDELCEAYIAGMRAYAWWQNGVEMVGTCGTTFKEAAERVHREVEEANAPAPR
jgi:hypothetical protein